MPFSQTDFERAASAIHAAAFDPEAWPLALGELRAAGGGWSGQLAGVHPRRGLAFDFCDGVPDEVRRDFERLGGADPTINPLARIFGRLPGGAVVTDHELFAPGERGRNDFYNAFLLPAGSRHVTMLRVKAPGDLRVIMSVIRSGAQGPTGVDEARALGALAAPMQATLRLLHTVESYGARLALSGFSALLAPAFVCDHWGRVLEATEAGDAELACGGVLRVSGRRLRAVDRQSDDELQAALRAVAARGPATDRALQRTVLLRRRVGLPTIADVAQLPGHAFSRRTGSASMVILRRKADAGAEVWMLRHVFGLTEAEATVAMSLFEGASAGEIAQARDTAVHTVRSQMKAIFQKTGVGSQRALARTLRELFDGRPAP